MAHFEVPDAGRAWLIAFAACFINMILSGLARVIGILYVAIIEDYGVSRKTATLPFITRNAVRCLSGPIVGVMGQRFGIRAVTFWGGVIASIGAFLCYFSTNITSLVIFWGGIHGFGFALANTLFQVAVNQYFERHRATASGIATSGACLGSLAFPFLVEGVLDAYGLAGGFVVLSGLVMHVLPPALLLKSPPWVEDAEGYARQKYYFELSKGIRTQELHPAVPNNVKNLLKQHGENRDEKTELEITQNVCQTAVSFAPDDLEISVMKSSNEVDPTDKQPGAKIQRKQQPLQNPATILRSMGSILFLCKNPMYLLTCSSMAIFILVFLSVVTCVVDYSMDKNIPESQGKYLIIGTSIGDLVGRLCFGWITDKGIISMPTFMTLTLVLQGVSIALFPFIDSFFAFLTLLVLYGVISGSIFVLFPVLVHKYVEEEWQSVAIGCSGFLPGVISLNIPFLIGYFRDDIGSYDGLFYLTGAISICVGSLWLFEHRIKKTC